MQPYLVAVKAHGNSNRIGDRAVIERTPAATPAETTLEFGRFCLLPRQRRLLADGVPVELGARAFDLLLALVEAGGRLVGKTELLSRVWSGVAVEENNLHFQISTLRRALGQDRDFIRTVSGRGYCFAAPVSAVAPAPDTCPTSPRGSDPIELPYQLVELSGQLAELAGRLGSVLGLLRAHDATKIARPWDSETQTQ